jgi:pilus assembly protein Flp/PilA
MKSLIQKFLRDESGATMVEYGIMVALIAAIAIGTVAILGGNVDEAFTSVNTALDANGAGGGGAGGEGG